jgi:putative PIN family toxin of toxin-antitoxin system
VIRAVVDCNVVVAAALSGGTCAELLGRARALRGFELVWSPPIVAECLQVVAREKFRGRFRTDPTELVEKLARLSRMVPTDMLPRLQAVKADPADDVYLATALAGGAGWIVSGNTRHLTPLDGFAGLRIVTPAVFLLELDAQP